MFDRRGMQNLSLDERFNRAVMPEPNSGCWLWTGAPQGSMGYGRIKTDRGLEAAHRYSWRRHKGEIPSGLFVLHKCDNPACVNPDHLFAGTHQDNQDDKVSKGRQARGAKLAHPRASGERSGTAKLTAQQVAEIRASSTPQRALAARYGVTQAAISLIKIGRNWK